ncbi:hypothetical protein FACS1894166_07820 [Bacilli bacterium]|nr:hypothetical protein FACS1894166_07820 [Bacilli bacterium]
MAKMFHLKVNTPSGALFEDDIYEIELKTPDGVLGILADHQPIIGSILPSVCKVISTKDKVVNVLINTGIFKMDGKSINVITDFFEFTDDPSKSVLQVRRTEIDKALAQRNLKESDMFDQIKKKLIDEIKTLEALEGRRK